VSAGLPSDLIHDYNPDQPDGGGNFDACTAITNGMQWDDVDCDFGASGRDFVCELGP